MIVAVAFWDCHRVQVAAMLGFPVAPNWNWSDAMMTAKKGALAALAILVAAAITQDANARPTGGGYGWKAVGHQTTQPNTHPKSQHHIKK